MTNDYTCLKQYIESIEEYETVVKYLDENTTIFPETFPILECIKKIFPEQKVMISIHNDCEFDDQYLLIEICFEDYPSDLLSRIDDMDKVIVKSITNIKSGWMTVITHLI